MKTYRFRTFSLTLFGSNLVPDLVPDLVLKPVLRLVLDLYIPVFFLSLRLRRQAYSR